MPTGPHIIQTVVTLIGVAMVIVILWALAKDQPKKK